MTPYDEGQVTSFIDDAVVLYRTAHASVNPYALVWMARMQFDAITMGYAAARAKHLHDLWDALGQRGPEPVIVEPDPLGPVPPNIRTTDRHAVDLRVTWWLHYFKHPDHHDWWMAAIFDELYHEGHDVGWTADMYWPGKMRDEYGEPSH